MLILIKLLSLKSGAFAGVHDCISGPPPFFFYSVIMSDGLFMPAEEVSLEGKRGSRISQTARGVIWRFEAALTATQAKPPNMASNLAFEDVIWSRSVVTATRFGTKWGINGVPNGPLRTFGGGGGGRVDDAISISKIFQDFPGSRESTPKQMHTDGIPDVQLFPGTRDWIS